MKPETETALRSIVSMDAEVTKESLEHAIDILRGKADADSDLLHVIKFKDAADILKVTQRTIRYYVAHGYLDRVFGGGDKALGISRESIFRFQTRRVVKTRRHTHLKPGARRRP